MAKSSVNKRKLCVIHGPNLCALGKREPEIYGSLTLEEINQQMLLWAQTHQVDLEIYQSNHEGNLVDKILSFTGQDGLVINPAAFTHTSIAIRDALLTVGIPIIEVHLSNIYRREEFRRHSFVSDVAVGVISGLGAYGYLTALNFLNLHLNTTN